MKRLRSRCQAHDTDTGVKADGTFFGHSGAAPGINGELRVYPGTGHVIAVLSNLEPPAAMRVAAFAGHRVPER